METASDVLLGFGKVVVHLKFMKIEAVPYDPHWFRFVLELICTAKQYK